MNQLQFENIDISVPKDDFLSDSIDCIDTELPLYEIEASKLSLLEPRNENQTHTLVLDIDETLLSVRRWIDECQIHDNVVFKKTNNLCKVIKITKEVTLQYDDGVVNVYSFYFTTQQPFGQLTSSLDVGDRMDIGGRLASVVCYIYYIYFHI